MSLAVSAFPFTAKARLGSVLCGQKAERSPALKENPPRVHSMVERSLFSEHVVLECFDQRHREPRSLLRGSSWFNRGQRLFVHCSVQGLLCELEFNCCSLFQKSERVVSNLQRPTVARFGMTCLQVLCEMGNFGREADPVRQRAALTRDLSVDARLPAPRGRVPGGLLLLLASSWLEGDSRGSPAIFF